MLGHIIGAILMGLALRGSIATVGWLAMLLTTPMHVLAFVVLQMPALDMAAWLLMTLAFVYCAVKIVKTPNDEWDLPPLGQARPGSGNNLGRDHKQWGGSCRMSLGMVRPTACDNLSPP